MGLKIPRPQGHEGSTPSLGTNRRETEATAAMDRSEVKAFVSGFVSITVLLAATAFAQVTNPTPEVPPTAIASAKSTRYIHAINGSLGEPAAGALARILGVDRQLLAARSYLRSGAMLASKWSWTQDRIDLYPDTDEYRAAMTAIDQVKVAFAQANPGFELYVNTEVRSLDVQVERWNANTSVGIAAQATLSACEVELANPIYPDAPDDASRERFAAFLVAWFPDPPPNLAAPGLSPHGQSRAYDFQVMKDGQLVAGTDSTQVAAVWNDSGWKDRLASAVAAVGGHFQGPLGFPDEPWHYQYTP